jgi:diaminopimelate epimerase
MSEAPRKKSRKLSVTGHSVWASFHTPSKMLSFRKMHGLGNDFVLFDARQARMFILPASRIIRIADRRRGIGCDQVIVLVPSEVADARMEIYNADGSASGACGNATRCVAKWLMEEHNLTEVTVETVRGVLKCQAAAGGKITVDMGLPRLDWQEIPLREEADTLHLPVTLDILRDPVGVNMGNPHAVFFVADVDAVPLDQLGPNLEVHPLFPERANIGIAAVQADMSIRLRVWERGTGETPACGTGACAALVAAVRRQLIPSRQATVHLPGGALHIRWERDEAGVWMCGPAEESFRGEWNPEP